MGYEAYEAMDLVFQEGDASNQKFYIVLTGEIAIVTQKNYNNWFSSRKDQENIKNLTEREPSDKNGSIPRFEEKRENSENRENILNERKTFEEAKLQILRTSKKSSTQVGLQLHSEQIPLSRNHSMPLTGHLGINAKNNVLNFVKKVFKLILSLKIPETELKRDRFQCEGRSRC